MKHNKKEHLLNDEIRASEVRVTDEGIMSISNALKLAESQELDLVCINPNMSPPICKIMNYEKFIYEQNKKPKNKSLEMKEIKVGPNTSENDLGYRIKHMSDFLKKGHSVKITMQFSGRELAHVETAKTLILKMIVAVEDDGIPESLPKLEGKKMFCLIRPKNKK